MDHGPPFPPSSYSPGVLKLQSSLIILDDQFLRSKNGDRFFFTHKDQAGSFTRQGRQILIDRTLSGVICDNTDITDAPKDAFKLTQRGDFISCDNAPKINQKEIRELLKFGKYSLL